MIDYLRYALYAALAILGMLLFQAWDKEHPAKQSQPANTVTQTIPTNNYIPTITPSNVTADKTATSTTQNVAPSVESSHLIHVKTDVLDVNIDALGGNITQVALQKFPESLNSKTPYLLLNDSNDTKYIAQSGLLSAEGPDSSKGQALYTTEKSDYVLANHQNDIQVKLNWQNQQGLKVSKIFTLHRDSYVIEVAYQVGNQSKQAWEGNLYLQLMRKNAPPPNKQGLVSLATYFGAAISSPEKPYEKVTFKQMQKDNLNQTITGGWAAMIQHYFVSAWIPEENMTSQYFSRITSDDLYTIGLLGQKLTATPGTTVTTHAKFYAGPSSADRLKTVAPGLQLTIDYGWFWLISVAIFWLMDHIHNIVGNWGWSIVLTTLVIKLLFYHLSAKSYRSMSVLKKLQPTINTLKERYGTDKQKFTQATMELYKKEKVNPMSGCLPVLVQIPVFIGLYWVLIESVALRQAPFVLWIQDLSQKDPFYILPVMMGISMFLQQRLNPPPPDPMQAKVMMFMPVIFTALFLNFPAGLMLYWFVNNSLSFLQQWYIMRQINGNTKPKNNR